VTRHAFVFFPVVVLLLYYYKLLLILYIGDSELLHTRYCRYVEMLSMHHINYTYESAVSMDAKNQMEF